MRAPPDESIVREARTRASADTLDSIRVGWPEMAPFWDPWLRPYGTLRWRAWKWRCAHALSQMDFGLAGAHKTRCQGTPQGPDRPVSTGLWRVVFGRPLPGPPQSTLESGVRAIFFYFLSSAHRAPNETRQISVEAVLRDPTRTPGHYFYGHAAKLHVGPEIQGELRCLRNVRFVSAR